MTVERISNSNMKIILLANVNLSDTYFRDMPKSQNSRHVDGC